MKKLLTTITLLCFSVAANAETYVCSVDVQAYTTPSIGFLENGSDIRDVTPLIGSRSYVLDTEKGWKPIYDAGTGPGVDASMYVFGGKEEWKGTCAYNIGFIICKSGDDPYEIFSINPIRLGFSYTYNYAGSAAIARSGSCVKT
jgi:hypothetical protein